MKLDVTTILIKGVTAAALSVFLYRAVEAWHLYHRPNLILLALAEGITVILVLIARKPEAVRTEPTALFVTGVATFYYLFIYLGPGHEFLEPLWTELLQTIGILLQIWGKITLGNRFGLLPARRGIVTHGPYRLVRHPIYTGYLINHIGFMLASFSWHNLMLLAGQYLAQGLRIIKEEEVLSEAPEYRDYKKKTRWRMVPFIF